MINTEARTSAATAARMRASEEKMARRLAARGWFCSRTGEMEQPAPGMVLFATNGLRETYRVVGTDEHGQLWLKAGADGAPFPGYQSYVFTVGCP